MNPPRLSVLSRLRNFYERNPDEELTFEQIALKFGCSLKSARHAVYDLKAQGVIESTHVIRLRIRGIAKEAL